jgi:hypothetical protein
MQEHSNPSLTEALWETGVRGTEGAVNTPHSHVYSLAKHRESTQQYIPQSAVILTSTMVGYKAV